MTIFVDANYTEGDTHSDVYTIELEDLCWDDVYEAITELFDWEEKHNKFIDFIEVWEPDADTPLVSYERAEALALCNSILKQCRSIWRTT